MANQEFINRINGYFTQLQHLPKEEQENIHAEFMTIAFQVVAAANLHALSETLTKALQTADKYPEEHMAHTIFKETAEHIMAAIMIRVLP